MSQNYLSAFILAAAGAATAGSALAQTPQAYRPGETPASRLQARQPPGTVIPGAQPQVQAQAQAETLVQTSWLHPQYEAAMIAEAKKRGAEKSVPDASFDPAGRCERFAKAAGQIAPRIVENQVDAVVTGAIKQRAYSDSKVGSVLGQHALGMQTVNRQQEQGEQRVCSLIIQNNGFALNNNLGPALGSVYNVVANAMANNMVDGIKGVQAHMTDRNNQNTIDNAAGALIPGLGKPGGKVGEWTCKLTNSCK